MSKKDTEESYTKSLTLSTDLLNSKIRFFYNPLFRQRLQQYLKDMYTIECKIQMLETQDILLTLNGEKSNVKTVREAIPKLFESIQEKIFDDENLYKNVVNWSRRLTSDLIVPVIQHIMDQQKIFTVWEKTAMFDGYFKVIYFTHESFQVAENCITDVLNHQIEYVENIAMSKEVSKHLLNDINQFISNNRQPELAIIHCKYPYKSVTKISLFGQKKSVKNIRKQLQNILSKHLIKTAQLKIDLNQKEYLLENCIEDLKDIEDEYKDDSVKIRIRLREFSAPQYLIEIIEQKIYKLLVRTIVCVHEQIGNSTLLTDYDRKELNRIAAKHYGRIDRIEVETTMKVYSIPKAYSVASNVSNFIIQQSNEFLSSLTMRRILVSNGSIEIYLTNQSTSIPRDITIISSMTGAAAEHLEFPNENGYIEVNDGRKIFFHHWIPTLSDDEKSRKKFKTIIGTFVVSMLRSIATVHSSIKTVAFLTNEWENIGVQRRLIVNYFIDEIKQELLTRKVNWRILLIFNHQQTDFYKEFYEAFIQLQTDQDGFTQFETLVSLIQITLTASSYADQTKCEKEVNNYIESHVLSHQILHNETDIRHWDQHMINALYRYCLNNSVLLKFELNKTVQLHFMGSSLNVEKAVEKYKLMSNILKQKPALSIPPPVTPRKSVQGKTPSIVTNRLGYNIYFVYCPEDQTVCRRLTNCLVGEGFSMCESPSSTSSYKTSMEKSDVILVAFSENFSNSQQSMTELNHAKSIKKLMIPFVIRNVTADGFWLSSLTLAESFYDLFDREIDIEFKDDFDLEFDKLVSKSLNFTKPGAAGTNYPETNILPKIARNEEEYEEGVFGGRSIALQKITAEQRDKREREYQEQVREKINLEKITDDDMENSVEDLKDVINELEEVLKRGHADTALLPNEYDSEEQIQIKRTIDENLQTTIRDFVNCARRWINKLPNVIKDNIAPFTPTGDINDAIFTIHRSKTDRPFMPNSKPFDYLTQCGYFSSSDVYFTSSFNTQQAHEYAERLFRSTEPLNKKDFELKSSEAVEEAEYLPVLGNELRSPKQMRKINELDNPTRIWNSKPELIKFIEQKLKNNLELKELCEKST